MAFQKFSPDLEWVSQHCGAKFDHEVSPKYWSNSWPRGESEVKVAQSCPPLCNPMDCRPWNSPDQNTGVGNLSLLQRIFPTQGSNPGLPHCRRILSQLSHKGSQRILEWAAYPFSSRSSPSQESNRCIAGGFFTNWAIREAPKQPICHQKMNALKRVSVCICREIYRYRHVKFRVSLKGNSDTCQKWMKF